MIVLFIISLGLLSVEVAGSREQLKDEDLLARYAKGDLKAFEVLYMRHRKPIYNFILRSVHSPERAEELVQEVFMRLVQNASSYARDAKFTTWLYTIARNICIDTHRRNQNRKRQQHVSLQRPMRGDAEEGITLEKRLEDPHAEQAGEDRVFHQQIQEALEHAVTQLSDEQREVFLLRETSHLAYQNIAQIVGVSENTVKSRMRYALEHLRKHMKSSGFSLKDIVG